MTIYKQDLSIPDLTEFVYIRNPAQTKRARAIIESAYQVSWAHGKRQEYLHTLKHRKTSPHSISDKNLLKIFEIYHNSVANGMKIPLRTFTEATGIHPTGIIRVLEKVNLHPPKLWSKKPSNKSGLSLEQLTELAKLGFQHYDIDHFTNVDNCARQRMRKNGIQTTLCPIIVEAGLSLSSSSKIYKHWDDGNDEHYIQNKFHVSMKKIDYVLDNRRQIAPIILEGLEIIKPELIIMTPYWP